MRATRTAPSCERRGVEVISTTGGHHFDGDYDGLARRILDGLKRKGALIASFEVPPTGTAMNPRLLARS